MVDPWIVGASAAVGVYVVLYELGWFSLVAWAAAQWGAMLIPILYAVESCLKVIDSDYFFDNVAVFWLAVVLTSAAACWCAPRCAATFGLFGFAYDNYLIWKEGPDAQYHNFIEDLRLALIRLRDFAARRGLDRRELVAAGVGMCLAAFAAGYWAVVKVEATGVAPLLTLSRAAWAWAWLRCGAGCFFGLVGMCCCWCYLNVAWVYIAPERVTRLANLAAIAGGTALWFYAWHLVVGFGWLITAYVGYAKDEAEHQFGRKRRVAKLILLLVLAAEPGAVAAAVRAEFLGEGYWLDQLGLVTDPGGRLFVRAALVALGFRGSVRRLATGQPGFDAGYALAMYLGLQVMWPFPQLCVLGQIEAMCALIGALYGGGFEECLHALFLQSLRQRVVSLDHLGTRLCGPPGGALRLVGAG